MRANCVTLPVEFISSVVLRIPAGDVCYGRGDYSNVDTTLELRDAFYVPGPCASLLSTKAMFQKQGICTYLIDELRPVLPNNNHVRIREISANYSVMLSSDIVVYVVTNENTTIERAKGQVGQFESLVHAPLGHFSIDNINACANHARGIE
eukprot:6188944-Pleurochrysis_carterae.AAC.3